MWRCAVHRHLCTVSGREQIFSLEIRSIQMIPGEKQESLDVLDVNVEIERRRGKSVVLVERKSPKIATDKLEIFLKKENQKHDSQKAV